MPKTIVRKLRPEAFEQQLSAPQLSALRSACTQLGFDKAVEFAKEHFGLETSSGALHRWYHRDDHLLVLSMVANGTVMNSQLEEEYKKHPAPQMTTLVKLFQTLIMQLSVEGATAPGMLELANTLFKSALDYVKEQGKAEDRQLARQRFEKESDGFFKMLLDKAVELNASNLSQADKIAAMRQAAFKDVDALQASGQIKLPKSR